MNQTLRDTIEREIVIRASKERVYAALADEAQIAQWFPDGIEGRLTPGERPVLDFGEYGKFSIYVVAAEPYTYFAYRWLPGSAYVPHGFQGDVLTKPNTLVEFTLEDVADGTRVKLRESGFAGLPKETYEASLKDNNEGWDVMMARLQSFVETGVAKSPGS